MFTSGAMPSEKLLGNVGGLPTRVDAASDASICCAGGSVLNAIVRDQLPISSERQIGAGGVRIRMGGLGFKQ